MHLTDFHLILTVDVNNFYIQIKSRKHIFFICFHKLNWFGAFSLHKCNQKKNKNTKYFLCDLSHN